MLSELEQSMLSDVEKRSLSDGVQTTVTTSSPPGSVTEVIARGQSKIDGSATSPRFHAGTDRFVVKNLRKCPDHYRRFGFERGPVLWELSESHDGPWQASKFNLRKVPAWNAFASIR